MAMIHHEPHPNFDSPATQVFALEGRLSSCMAENAALHEQAMRLRLTDEESEAIAACAAACENAAQYGIAEDARRASTLRGLLARTTLLSESGARHDA
jgi:uncharacterized membrane protein